ncbi:uncharacterized protein V1516DRAFT_392083 [Lipomyces oligophaga]|uniref:uncharacterized protein n=1 Tax=Lipomyces oligophaga TaxID=45792 RepID=UPI0034CE309F
MNITESPGSASTAASTGDSTNFSARYKARLDRARQRLREVDNRILLLLTGRNTGGGVRHQPISAPVLEEASNTEPLNSAVPVHPGSLDLRRDLQPHATTQSFPYSQVHSQSSSFRTSSQTSITTPRRSTVSSSHTGGSSLHTGQILTPQKAVTLGPIREDELSKDYTDSGAESDEPQYTTAPVSHGSLSALVTGGVGASAIGGASVGTSSRTRSEQRGSAHEPRRSHADLLKQIEDDLMLETPLEFAMGSNRGSDSEQSSSSQPSDRMTRSVSEPLDVRAKILSADTSPPRPTDRRASEDPDFQIPPLSTSHDSLSSMEDLLQEVRMFRSRVEQLQESVPRSTPQTPQVGQLDSLAPGDPNTTAGPQPSPGSARSLDPESYRMSNFSLHSPSSEQHRFVTIGQPNAQPSSVYIPAGLRSIQGQEQHGLAEHGISEETMQDLEPPPQLTESEIQTDRYQELETDIVNSRHPSLFSDSKGISTEPDLNHPGDPTELVLSCESGEPESESTHVLKNRRSVSSIRSTRPSLKPRGPRSMSSSSSLVRAQPSVESLKIELSSRPASAPIGPEETQELEVVNYQTAESSPSDSDNEDDDILEDPPELPRRSSGRVRKQLKVRSVLIDPVPATGRSVSDSTTRSSKAADPLPSPYFTNPHRPRPSGPRRHRKSSSHSVGTTNVKAASAGGEGGPKSGTSRNNSNNKPFYERPRVTSTLYGEPRKPDTIPEWYLDKETNNLDWQGKGKEFSELIHLEFEHKRILERFIETLGKLSVEVGLDEKKRIEGRRRMDNALLALEGWI